MPSPFDGKTIAILVGSGFEEKPFVDLQRALASAGATVKVISRDTGLTNSWANGTWGLSYPVDAHISETLAVDFDAFVIPDGKRHTDILINEAHVRRLASAFLRESAPSLLIGSGVELAREYGFADSASVDEVTTMGALVLAPAGAEVEEILVAFEAAMVNASAEEAAA
ncbi:DJ-1/PfpI family protein [Alphaproteobacteria bacterium LSUCC0684]